MAFDRLLSAGGKLFVSGEYSVLWGGTARILAVNPRVSAQVRPREDRTIEVLLAGGKWTGTATPLGVRWSTPPSPDIHFVGRAFDLALRVAGKEGPGFSVAFEPSPTFGTLKLGLGSSARATVLAVEAARVVLGASYDSLKLALLAHADAQSGKGSGGDVVASFAGGLVRYRRWETASLLERARKGGFHAALEHSEPVDVAKVGTPVFPMLFVFSGESASTTSLVAKADAQLDATARARFVDRSDEAGDGLEHGLIRRQFDLVQKHCAALQEALWGLAGTRHEGLERVVKLAGSYGCAAKQSGAGGGDGALVFAPDDATRQSLLEAYQSRGLFAFPIEVADGMRGDAGPHAQLARWLDE